MKLSKKMVIPLLLLIVAAAAGGGYYLWQGKAHQGKEEMAAQGPTQYTCPMHPFIIKDKPGVCPICNMNLVPVKKGGEGGQKEGAGGVAEVALSPTQMVTANVETVAAELKAFDREINAVGIVQYDQSRQARVTAWVSGRIDRLFVDRVGDYVSTKRPVAEIYSPDLVATQEEYLLALKSRERLRNSPISSIAEGGDGLVESARQRLQLWGVKDHQIEALAKGGRPNIRLPIYTPLSGIVIEKLVLVGQYVKEGDPLFSIADLSSVWTELEVYETDFPLVKTGQKVDVVSQSYPGKTFRGRITYIYPFLDPKTRTVRARVEIPNRGLMLKPEMFVSAVIRVPMGRSMVVPVNAVIDTGRRQLVWIEVEKGRFRQREVKVGARSGNEVQIVAGLNEGEKVAASGGYLIDSEAQLKGGGGGEHAGHEGMKIEEKGGEKPAPSGHQGHESGTPPKKDDMGMDDMKM